MHWKYPDYCAIFRMKLLQIILSQDPVDTGRRMIPKVSELLANTEGHEFHSGFSASLGNALGRLGYLPWLDRASPHLEPGSSKFPHGAGPRSLLPLDRFMTYYALLPLLTWKAAYPICFLQGVQAQRQSSGLAHDRSHQVSEAFPFTFSVT